MTTETATAAQLRQKIEELNKQADKSYADAHGATVQSARLDISDAETLTELKTSNSTLPSEQRAALDAAIRDNVNDITVVGKQQLEELKALSPEVIAAKQAAEKAAAEQAARVQTMRTAPADAAAPTLSASGTHATGQPLDLGKSVDGFLTSILPDGTAASGARSILDGGGDIISRGYHGVKKFFNDASKDGNTLPHYLLGAGAILLFGGGLISSLVKKIPLIGDSPIGGLLSLGLTIVAAMAGGKVLSNAFAAQGNDTHAPGFMSKAADRLHDLKEGVFGPPATAPQPATP